MEEKVRGRPQTPLQRPPLILHLPAWPLRAFGQERGPLPCRPNMAQRAGAACAPRLGRCHLWLGETQEGPGYTLDATAWGQRTCPKLSPGLGQGSPGEEAASLAPGPGEPRLRARGPRTGSGPLLDATAQA